MSISFWPLIQSLGAGPSGTPAPIVRDSQWTIVGVTTSVDGMGNEISHVKLPSGCDVGDVVEVHNDGTTPATNPQVAPPSGESFYSGVSVTPGPRFFRKISATIWGFFG